MHSGRGRSVPVVTGATGDAGEWAQVAPTLAEELTIGGPPYGATRFRF